MAKQLLHTNQTDRQTDRVTKELVSDVLSTKYDLNSITQFSAIGRLLRWWKSKASITMVCHKEKTDSWQINFMFR
jgi:hypothetical protein